MATEHGSTAPATSTTSIPDPDRDSGGRASGRRRFVVAVAATAAVAVLIATLVVVRYPAQDAYVFGAPGVLPDMADVLPGAEQVSYLAEDGVELHAWFLPATAPGAGYTAVVFHGSHSTRAGMAEEAMLLAERGVAVFLAEYRGFGDAGGQPSEEGLRLDGEAAVRQVRALPGVDGSRLVYVGYSLGTGVAVDAALADPPSALVLWAPYTSLVDLAAVDFPGLPHGLLMRTRFDSLSKMSGVDAPVLVVRGDDDDIVPGEQSQQVFDAAHEPKALVTVDDADHGLEGPTGHGDVDATIAFLDAEAPVR